MNRQLQKEYRILGKMGEGTFSEVFKCQRLADEKYLACKKMKQRYESRESVDALREIQSMKKLVHPNILQLEEIIFDSRSGSLALILELMDMNIYELIRGRKQFLGDSKVCYYMWQLCQALDHTHSHGIFHRDVKPENILIKGDTLKLADFGSCRSINSRQPYTEYISTRWYRAPECLLTDGCYSYQMDCWSAGCVMYEIMSLKPLFPGSNEVDQIARIHDIIGTPSVEILNKFKNKTRAIPFNFPKKKGTGIERLLPQASVEAIDLIKRFCEYDPDRRLSARLSLKHPYFKTARYTFRSWTGGRKNYREKYPLTRRDVSPLQSRENKENQGLHSPKKTTNSSNTTAANVDYVPSLTLKSIDNQAPVKDKDRRKKRRKPGPYFSQGQSANLTFPSLFNKNQSSHGLGHTGFTSNGLPKMHLPTLFPDSKFKSKFQHGNGGYHQYFFGRFPPSEKPDYSRHSLPSHQMK